MLIARRFEDGRQEALQGNIDAALAAYKLAVLECLSTGVSPLIYGINEIPISLLMKEARDPSLAEVVELELCAIIIEDLANSYSDFRAAEPFHILRSNLKGKWNAKRGDGNLYLGDDWVRNIGHITTISYFVKMQLLGLAWWNRIKIVCDSDRVANWPLLDMLSDYIDIIFDKDKAEHLIERTTFSGFRSLDHIDVAGFGSVPIISAYNCIEHLWRVQGRNELIIAPPSLLEEGEELKKKLNIPLGSWFVCVHVRDAGFHRDFGATHRDADINTYEQAASIIREAGGYVIRLGTETAVPVGERSNIIDYPHSSFRNPRLDVYLTAANRFMIATDSGPMCMPLMFGRPSLITNYRAVFGPPPMGNTSLFLPKLTVHKDRVIPFDELMTKEWRQARHQVNSHDAIKARYLSNSPAEIALATLEMLKPGGGLTPFQRQFSKLASAGTIEGDAAISASFADNHWRLFPSHPRRAMTVLRKIVGLPLARLSA